MSPSSRRPRRSVPPTPAGTAELVDALRATLEPIAQAVGAELVPLEALDEGDIPVAWEGRTLLGFRLPGLHGALERLLRAVEREEGMPLRDLPREAKQRVVERLDKAGAFTVRRAAEEVADALGVSRFTVYNYLNAIRDQADWE